MTFVEKWDKEEGRERKKKLETSERKQDEKGYMENIG
jgi:hypothetical protein